MISSWQKIKGIEKLTLLSSSTQSIPITRFKNLWSVGLDDGSLVTSKSG